MFLTNQTTNNKKVITYFFFLVWFFLVTASPWPFIQTVNYIGFSLLGIVGAIFANSTGAGGGVVFIPFFAGLDFDNHQSVATSFAIQCFGMTAGALTWYIHYQKEKQPLKTWTGFKRIVTVCSIFSILGIWCNYYFQAPQPYSLNYSFSLFSLILGIAIILTTLFIKPTKVHSQLRSVDIYLLASVSFIGGFLTAWLSVAVGELIAIYLILRRYDITMAVATAVMVSAFTVWSAVPYHFFEQNIYWQVVIFAGPGAIIGGILAKKLVNRLSVTKLKLFFASWLLVIGGFGIV